MQTLIISTGDISDVDGFYALHEYAKTGADVLFIMNFPAYVSMPQAFPDYAESHLGLGFKFSALDVIKEDSPFMQHYKDLEDPNTKMAYALSDMGYLLANYVWKAACATGKLYYCVGEANLITPFSSKCIKNEITVYEAIRPHTLGTRRIEPHPGHIYNCAGDKVEHFKFSKYDNIYMDGNGSFAFLDDIWISTLMDTIIPRLDGFFMMGSVRSDEAPLTKPAIPGILNRLSAATMNQLYHPTKCALFLQMLALAGTPIYVVSNNTVSDVTEAGLPAFLHSIKCSGVLETMALAYYAHPSKPARKPFDYYTALALTRVMQGEDLKCAIKNVFISPTYGTTLLSDKNTFEKALAEYKASIGDNKAFDKELEIMSDPEFPVYKIPRVRDLSMAMDPDTKAIAIV